MTDRINKYQNTEYVSHLYSCLGVYYFLFILYILKQYDVFALSHFQNLSSTYPGEEGLRVLAELLPKNTTLHILRLECKFLVQN